MDNQIKIDDLGGFPIIFGNTHIDYRPYVQLHTLPRTTVFLATFHCSIKDSSLHQQNWGFVVPKFDRLGPQRHACLIRSLKSELLVTMATGIGRATIQSYCWSILDKVVSELLVVLSAWESLACWKGVYVRRTNTITWWQHGPFAKSGWARNTDLPFKTLAS